MSELTRRSILKAAGAVGTMASVAGCADSTSQPEDNGSETNFSDDKHKDGDTGQNAFQQELKEVRTAIQRYNDYTAALKDGYTLTGPYVRGMGWHFINGDLLNTAAENGPDRTKPPILTYFETESGLTLGAAEYAIPTKAVDGKLDLFSDEDADADVQEEWHTHEAATHVFALGDGKQHHPDKITFEQLRTKDAWTEFHPPDESIKAGDTVSLNWGTTHGKEGKGEERIVDRVTTHPNIETLHVWVGEENPDGVLAPMNPRFVEEEDGHSHDQ